MRHRVLRCLLLGGIAFGALSASAPPAHAIFGVGDIVFDPSSYAELVLQLQQLQQQFNTLVQQYNQLVTTYNAFTQVRNLGSAMAALNLAGIQNPLPVNPASVQTLISGGGSVAGITGAIGHLFTGAVGNNGFMMPTGNSWREQQMTLTANGLSGVQALAQQHYQTNSDRLTQLAALRARLATASDPKDIMDIQASLQAVQADMQSQGQQIQAAAMMADVQARVETQRDQQYEYACITQQIAYFNRTSDSQVCPVPGTGTPIAGSGSSGGATMQPVITTTGGGGDVTSVTGATSASAPDALANLQSQPYGAAAIQAAQAAGVNPATEAAMGQIESGFTNANVGGSGAVGVWQMEPATYQSDAAAAGIPTDTSGRANPATEAVAVAQEIKQDGTILQNAGINPTGLDIRGAYNFGPGYAVPLAQAPDSALMSDVLSSYSAATLQANGITPGMTVGQWRQNVVNNAGPAILQPALLSSTSRT